MTMLRKADMIFNLYVARGPQCDDALETCVQNEHWLWVYI